MDLGVWWVAKKKPPLPCSKRPLFLSSAVKPLLCSLMLTLLVRFTGVAVPCPVHLVMAILAECLEVAWRDTQLPTFSFRPSALHFTDVVELSGTAVIESLRLAYLTKRMLAEIGCTCLLILAAVHDPDVQR